jgi:hypothetical protein
MRPWAGRGTLGAHPPGVQKLVWHAAGSPGHGQGGRGAARCAATGGLCVHSRVATVLVACRRFRIGTPQPGAAGSVQTVDAQGQTRAKPGHPGLGLGGGTEQQQASAGGHTSSSSWVCGPASLATSSGPGPVGLLLLGGASSTAVGAAAGSGLLPDRLPIRPLSKLTRSVSMMAAATGAATAERQRGRAHWAGHRPRPSTPLTCQVMKGAKPGRQATTEHQLQVDHCLHYKGCDPVGQLCQLGQEAAGVARWDCWKGALAVSGVSAGFLVE